MKSKSYNIFPKVPTGIEGLDEITGGGFPLNRPVLVCGTAGCGKTLMGMQFLVKGITDHNEPAVFMSFEEPTEDLILNVQSMGWDLRKYMDAGMLRIDHVKVERAEVEETGEYDLEALFIRLEHAISSVNAKRVVLDTIESLFSGMDNLQVLRSEIRRLFHWLKTRGVTTIITGERGDSSLTRQGLEEYVSDCVILLDFRVIEQIATRRLRIIKYRGSTHGTNEYPFIIDESGVGVLPITTIQLNHQSSDEVISTGLKQLDEMFHPGGVFRGSCTLISGSAGSAKTILASYFALSACKNNENVVYFSFEESPEELVRNMKSVGINLSPHVKSGKLLIRSLRPTYQGLEMHLILLYRLLTEHNPKTVIIDPMSSLITIGSNSEVRSMLIRLMDMMKTRQISSVFTALTADEPWLTSTNPTINSVSSLADTWIKTRNEVCDDEIVRSLFVVKSRGMGHTNEVSSFEISSKGIKLKAKRKQKNSNNDEKQNAEHHSSREMNK